jgi:hypothetical protein
MRYTNSAVRKLLRQFHLAFALLRDLPMNRIQRTTPALVVCLLLAACRSEAPKPRSTGEAFVGPATLAMRSELSASSPTLATLRHGEKLEVLQTRRRLVKVRNMGGTEGWVDSRYLLSSMQMAELQRTIQQANAMPSQGRATVFDALNVHNEPNRQSPSPFQVPAGGSVEVLAHLVTPRVAYQSPINQLVPPPKPVAKKPKRKKAKKGEKAPEEEKPEVEPPPMPAAPKVPDNWQELSKTDLPDDPKSPVKADDWSLVRLPDKKAGWVLMRMLYMAIPDDVAQYSEGKRISSYFALGEVKDEEVTKQHWLWTTLTKPLLDCDYDGMRVFIYNAKRHRYETAYRENEIRGFLPVIRHEVPVTENKKTFNVPGFTMTVEDDEGQRWKKTYAFIGNRVRLAQKEAAPKPSAGSPARTLTTAAPAPPSTTNTADKKSMWARIRQVFSK